MTATPQEPRRSGGLASLLPCMLLLAVVGTGAGSAASSSSEREVTEVEMTVTR